MDTETNVSHLTRNAFATAFRHLLGICFGTGLDTHELKANNTYSAVIISNDYPPFTIEGMSPAEFEILQESVLPF